LAKNLSYDSTTVTIANTATVSSVLTLDRGRIPLALITPAALTGTTFTFQSSADGNTYVPIYYESTAYSVTVSTSRHIALDRRAFEAVKYLKIVSGSAEGALRTIGVVTGE
jgi:hypothetical protein